MNSADKNNKLDASLKEGEIYGSKEAAKDFFGLGNVRRWIATIVGFFGVILIGFGFYWSGQGRLNSQAVETIHKTIAVTRSLYDGKVDVGQKSVIIPIILARPYKDGTVQIKWINDSLLDVKNDFGGILDVIGRGNHFELHYNGVPMDSCVPVADAFASSGMPLFVNTLPYQGKYDEASLKKACYAEINNMVWKFR